MTWALLAVALAGPLPTGDRVATKEGFDWKLDAWRGAPVAELLDAWGVPDRTFSRPDGGEMYIYENRRTHTTERITTGWNYGFGVFGTRTTGGDTIVTKCVITIHVVANHVATTRSEGEDCRFEMSGWTGIVGENWIEPRFAGKANARSKVRVVSVGFRSPASEAGVQPGDVLLQMDGAPVRSVADLERFSDMYSVGGVMGLLLQRAEERHQLRIVLGPPPR